MAWTLAYVLVHSVVLPAYPALYEATLRHSHPPPCPTLVLSSLPTHLLALWHFRCTYSMTSFPTMPCKRHCGGVVVPSQSHAYSCVPPQTHPTTRPPLGLPHYSHLCLPMPYTTTTLGILYLPFLTCGGPGCYHDPFCGFPALLTCRIPSFHASSQQDGLPTCNGTGSILKTACCNMALFAL